MADESSSSLPPKRRRFALDSDVVPRAQQEFIFTGLFAEAKRLNDGSNSSSKSRERAVIDTEGSCTFSGGVYSFLGFDGDLAKTLNLSKLELERRKKKSATCLDDAPDCLVPGLVATVVDSERFVRELTVDTSKPYLRVQERCVIPSVLRVQWLHNGSEVINVLGKAYTRDEMTNVTPAILSKVGRHLHHRQNHPLKLLREKVQEFVHANYRNRWGGPMFAMLDRISPVVTVEQNFDSLLVPEDHVSRSRSDNYYINSEFVLRAHTSAHERDLIKSGLDAFMVTGDVYRRDEIDRTHYPVFHQMEGARMFTRHELFADYEEPLELFEKNGMKTDEKQNVHTLEAVKLVVFNMKQMLERIVAHLCGDNVEMKWVETYFPFTHPSWELEVKFDGEWMEMLGCGVLEHGVLVKGGAENKIGWAFGVGLERLAMRLFKIPDIRLFWSDDARFLSQFEKAEVVEFKSFSKYPPVYKDVTFWLPEAEFSPNDLFEIIRGVAGDIVELVELIDKFVQPKTGRESHCYRITYRSMDKTLTDVEINTIQDLVRESLQTKLRVELR